MKRVLALAVVSVALAACSSDGPTGPSPTTVTAIVVAAPSPTMQVGTTMTAKARLLNSQGDSVMGKTPKWSTSSAAVATVDQNGVITAVAPGSVDITASADKATGSFPLPEPALDERGAGFDSGRPDRGVVHNDRRGYRKQPAAVHHREREHRVR